MSVRWTRSATIANGRFIEAAAWAKEVAAYIQKKWKTVRVQVWLDRSGPVGVMRWTSDWPDVASLEHAHAQIGLDPTYWHMLERAFNNGPFVDGSAVDSMCSEL